MTSIVDVLYEGSLGLRKGGVEMKHVLSSAVVTTPGLYEYRHIDAVDAKNWLKLGNWKSTVGYREAQALSELTGVEVPCDRRTITMAPGDEALVFRLVLPPGTRRIEPLAKGEVGRRFIEQNCEIGILTREK